MPVVEAVNKIRSFYENDVSTRIPFDIHPLKEADDYKKQLYCTMLAVIMQYENEPKREQLVLLERIVKGIGLELTLQQLLQKAVVVDEKFAKDFYEEFVDSELAQNFTVDVLLLVYALGTVEEKQLAFITEVVSVLNIDEADFKLLVTFAKAVLAKSSEELFKLFNNNPQLTLLNQFEYYYAPIIDTSIEQINKLVELDDDVLIFINMHFTPRINFECIEKRKLIIFKNCTFSEFETPIGLFNVNSVILDQCEIKNCYWNTFELHYVENMMMYACEIKDVKKSIRKNQRNDTANYGGIIQGNMPTNVYIINSHFNNVCLESVNTQGYNTFVDGIIYAGEIKHYTIKNNYFEECSFIKKADSKPAYFLNENVVFFMMYEPSNYSIDFLDGLTFIQYVSKNYALTFGENCIENNKNSLETIDIMN